MIDKIRFTYWGRIFVIAWKHWRQLKRRFNPRGSEWSEDVNRVRCSVCDEFFHLGNTSSCNGCTFHKVGTDEKTGCVVLFDAVLKKAGLGKRMVNLAIGFLTLEPYAEKMARKQLRFIYNKMLEIERANKEV